MVFFLLVLSALSADIYPRLVGTRVPLEEVCGYSSPERGETAGPVGWVRQKQMALSGRAGVETDGNMGQLGKGDIWQHGIGRSTSPYTGPNYRPGGSGFALEKVKGLLCLPIPPQTWAGMPWAAGRSRGRALRSRDRGLSLCRLLSLSQYLSYGCFSL